MTIFFSSDPHFFHEKIIQYSNRPYNNADEMNQDLIRNHNSVVAPNDIVYWLGDMFFSSDENECLNILERLHGQKFLVFGNHDRKLRKSRRLLQKFIWSGERREVYLDDGSEKGVPVVLDHYPLLTWHRAHHGAIMLHGHCHGNMRYPFAARIMDVGVDPCGYYPISETQVLNKMRNAVTPSDLDHHKAPKLVGAD